MHTMSISCSAADAVSSGCRLIQFKVLMLSVAVCTVLLHLSNFYLGLSSAADFSNTGARTSTSVERTPFLPAQRAMQFGYMV